MARHKRAPGATTPHTNEFIKRIGSISDRHRVGVVFDRFLEAAACALSNCADWSRREAREQRYLELIENDRAQQRAFAELLAIAKRALDEEPHDFFGEVTQGLNVVNRDGQVWTPYDVSELLVALVSHDFKDTVRVHGFCSILEPCSGPGGMIVANIEAAKKQGLDPIAHLYVEAVDIDPRCVHMSYIVCCLLGVAAVVHHANALDSRPPWSSWLTPAYIHGKWSERLRKADRADQAGSETAPGR